MLLNLELPRTIKGDNASSRSYETSHNLIPTPYGLKTRGGIALATAAPFNTVDWCPRGMIALPNASKIYAIFFSTSISASVLYAFDLDSNGDIDFHTRLGPLTMDSLTFNNPSAGGTTDYVMSHDDKYNASFALSFTHLAIATGTANYVVDLSTDTETAISDPDLPASRSVVYIDGYFVWVAADGETVHYGLASSPTSYSALDFFDAESQTDKNREAVVIGNSLYILGEKSIERFRSTGNSTTPFVRVPGATISIGYVGGLVEYADSVAFIGKSRNGGVAIYELAAGQIVKLSTPIIDDYLNHRSLRTSLASCHAQTYVDRGQRVTTFWIHNYDTRSRCFALHEGGFWSTYGDDVPVTDTLGLNSWKNERPVSSDLTAQPIDHFTWVNSVEAGGNFYFQRLAPAITESGLGRLSSLSATDTGSEASETVEHGIQIAINHPEHRDFTLDSIEVVFSTNFLAVDSNDILTLRISRDGDLWTEVGDLTMDTDRSGRLRFQKKGGLGRCHGTLLIQLYSTAEVPFVIERVIADIK